MLHVQTEAIEAEARPAPHQRLVIIGNGMSPGRALEKLFEAAPEAYKVTIFNAEPRVNYDRTMLSPVLSGEKTFEQIVIHGDGWYVDHGVTLYKGHRVVAIDREAKTVTSEHGIVEPYDKLIIAAGSMPIVIPVPGSKLAGVLTYRDLDDVNAMLLAAKSRGRAVVIGGGLLGLEAAMGLKERGMEVSVIHLMPTLMERQLDPPSGFLLKQAIEARGLEVYTEANTKEILGTYPAAGPSRVRGVLLDDGTELPADLVVMAVGIRPSAAIARDAGLAVNRGIVVGLDMRTSDPDVFALGECAEAHGQCFGLVAPLYDMASVVAAQLAGDAEAAFNPSATATKLKVTGINLFSAGDFADGEDRQEIVLRDAARGVYRRLVLKDDRLIGVVLYGDVSHGAWLFDLLKRGAGISDVRETMMFGPGAAGGAPLDPTAAVAALPDDAEICGCNGVCKGKIVGTINAKGLTSLDAVRAHTKASASCDSCTGLVETVIRQTLGDAYNPAAVQPACGRTDLGHDNVRRLIVAKALDAGLVSGAAYGNVLRTVKTCVGSDWCRFGTQDSTGPGIKLEKFLWGSWTPAKVKMAVSGCPRNCAEATCKDVGVICVDGGYDIVLAGAAGLDIKSTEALCHAASEEETIEIISALVQLYREQGRYLERIYKWAKRVGAEQIKAQVVDDVEKRRALYDRFVFSQKFAQKDPWAERVSGKDAHEFAPIADLPLAAG